MISNYLYFSWYDCYILLSKLEVVLTFSFFFFFGPKQKICSMFALLSLHLFMYGCNLFQWKRTRINYHFIFEFQPNTALKYRDAFLICTSVMTAVVGAMVIHLILLSSGLSPSQVDAIPGILLLVITHHLLFSIAETFLTY